MPFGLTQRYIASAAQVADDTITQRVVSNGTGDITAGAAAWAAMAASGNGAQLSITTTGGDVFLSFAHRPYGPAGGTPAVYFKFVEEGVGDVGAPYNSVNCLVTGITYGMGMSCLITGVSAGTHDYRVYWYQGAGVSTTSEGAGRQFSAIELKR